ncbi:hypothetical protein Z517_09244 [Fonsecaea pedrosoi CBS 271.37]|uniref:Zn(2)-C6 fungal-type domain-containing protein n=1 Tax=Fonsecaea pedrosoi CBS 271.37 TaxID=1442368 RepID=A0A0D2GDM8_9EURO|nr:uncharacterized protein Z517_09244 [Fonsecaea pedrosoi CBS 271.37]KIW76800.1 hypothetical protein Z517_09244 [Fonsecaea pedrosoi CBS 271.37]
MSKIQKKGAKLNSSGLAFGGIDSAQCSGTLPCHRCLTKDLACHVGDDRRMRPHQQEKEAKIALLHQILNVMREGSTAEQETVIRLMKESKDETELFSHFNIAETGGGADMDSDSEDSSEDKESQPFEYSRDSNTQRDTAIPVQSLLN